MAKKAILALIVAFAVYSVIATPTTSANAVKTAGRGVQAAGQSVLTFFHALST